MADDTSTNAPEMGGVEPHDDFDLPLTSSAPSAADQDAPAADPGTDDARHDQAQAAPDDGMGHYPAELATVLRDERLKPIPGETPEAAYARLNHHLIRKNTSYRRDLAREKDRHAQSIDAMRAELAPMLQAFYHQQRQAQLEAEAAQIPDRDADPEGYRLWLQERTLAELESRRQEEWEREQGAIRAQEEQATSQQLLALDEAGYSRVAQGLGLVQGSQPDPDFTAAYDTYSELAVESARLYFPDATDDQIQEFVSLSQRLDIRNFVKQGQDPVTGMKGRLNAMIDALVKRGYVTRATRGGVASTGNGNGRPSPAPAPKPPTSTPTSTAQRIEADAQAAARRGPSAVPPPTRPTQLPGQIPDPSDFASDEDFVEAALDGILGTEAARLESYKRRQAERGNRGGA